ncbi:MAG: hypothetical protein SFY92_07435 [Verrucomicrobiae bacterium]|nr:hypothetical protein [Verrucomicrobiae bacterium]
MGQVLAIVAEDRLTEAVLVKCVKTYLPKHNIIRSEVKGGRGNVLKEIPAYLNLAKKMPVIVGIDLDHDPCPPALLNKINLPNSKIHFILRIAVKEVESWILADKKRFSRFVNGSSDSIPNEPDNLPDPKLFLLEFARNTASSELKRDLLPVNFGQYPRIGPAYNLRMCDFTLQKWKPEVARKKSPSLNRAITALENLAAM